MIGSDCCFGPEFCLREQVQCICLHVHSVLLHSWFSFRVFIAIRRFAAGIQINPGRPGPLGHAVQCAPDAIRNPPHTHGLSQAAPPASAPSGLSGGVGALSRTPAPPAPGATGCAPSSSCSTARWARACAIQRVFS